MILSVSIFKNTVFGFWTSGSGRSSSKIDNLDIIYNRECLFYIAYASFY